MQDAVLHVIVSGLLLSSPNHPTHQVQIFWLIRSEMLFLVKCLTTVKKGKQFRTKMIYKHSQRLFQCADRQKHRIQLLRRWIKLNHCFNPLLALGTFHHLHHPPPPPIIPVSCYSIWADSREAFMWRGQCFIHRQPCQFPLPWQIFNIKVDYTFNMKTQVVWWTVKHKINCCCQEKYL